MSCAATVLSVGSSNRKGWKVPCCCQEEAGDRAQFVIAGAEAAGAPRMSHLSRSSV